MICSKTNSLDQPEQDPGTDTDRPNFEQQLRDVVAKIRITPDFAIVHSDYEPLVISDPYQDYLKQMSSAERDRYLVVKLQQYLYGIFNGDLKPKHNSALETEGNSKTDEEEQPKKMENYADKWYRTRFYQQLTQRNHGQGYSDPNWSVVEQEAKNLWKITKNGLDLHINPEKHLVTPTIELQIGQTVSIKMPSNLVDRGLYIAVGDAGSINNRESPLESTIVQLYCNVSSEGALLLLDRLTQQLNTLAIPFEFKIAYDEASFAYLDAAVLEFESVDFARLRPILQNVYQESQTYFKPKIPFFCKFLASGLGLAEKPHQVSDFESKNIGQYYCGIIAKALVAIWHQENEFNNDRLNYIFNCLSRERINIKYLYLNPDAKDSYRFTS